MLLFGPRMWNATINNSSPKAGEDPRLGIMGHSATPENMLPRILWLPARSWALLLFWSVYPLLPTTFECGLLSSSISKASWRVKCVTITAFFCYGPIYGVPVVSSSRISIWLPTFDFRRAVAVTKRLYSSSLHLLLDLIFHNFATEDGSIH
jgi:hypothetical protein